MFRILITVEFSAGGDKDVQMIRQDSGLYQPPAPADIERMRKQKVLEANAFAFLKEFLSQYLHFSEHWTF